MTAFANTSHYDQDDFATKVEVIEYQNGSPVCVEVIAGVEINETLAYARQACPQLSVAACKAARFNLLHG